MLVDAVGDYDSSVVTRFIRINNIQTLGGPAYEPWISEIQFLLADQRPLLQAQVTEWRGGSGSGSGGVSVTLESDDAP